MPVTIDSHEMRHSDYARSRYFIEGEDIHTYVYIRINYIYLYFADVVQCFYFARSSGITFQICGSFIQGVTAFVAFTEIAMISAPANINLWIFMTCYIYHSDVFFFADIIHTYMCGWSDHDVTAAKQVGLCQLSSNHLNDITRK